MENELQNIKLATEEQVNNMSYGEDKFLFFFKPKSIDNQCIGGFSLITGIIIFAVVSLLQAISYFSEGFSSTVGVEKFGYILLSIVFLLIAIFSAIAAFKENTTCAKVAYCLASILFIFAAIAYLCKSILKIIEFINPWDGDFLQLDFLIYILGRGLLLFIYLYFIWILFCFISNHEKNN